jgi:hypothetical protein
VRLALLLTAASFGLLLPSGHAAVLNLGIFCCDILVPPDGGSPGVVVFNIANLTGDAGTGGFALPPDFPSLTSATFLSATVTLYLDGPANSGCLGRYRSRFAGSTR